MEMSVECGESCEASRMSECGNFQRILLQDVLCQLGYKPLHQNIEQKEESRLQRKNYKTWKFPIWITLIVDFFIGTIVDDLKQ